MGTRGLTGFVINGEVKASYQQYDSYPDGVGLDVLTFARTLSDPAHLHEARRMAAALITVPEQGTPTPEQRSALAQFSDEHVSTGSDWYSTLRQCQGKPDKILASGFILDSLAFADESLFCEWAWLLDLDACTLECYKGFQTEYHEQGRFGGKRQPEDWAPKYAGDQFYYPVKMIRAYSFFDLPATDEQFVADLTPQTVE